ncbi:MAG TPA: FkbM family methyltransferase [Myxococcales bacterium]|nr:FkbM family methyltransferase [Myxococcales bacterium]
MGKMINIRPEVNIQSEWMGNDYGGFFVSPERMNDGGIVYSFGIGEDISFDRAMIEKYGCRVFAFDPTPKSIKWVEQSDLPSQFSFYPVGLGAQNGSATFYLPKNKEHVSGSMVTHNNLDETSAIEVEMKSFTTIVDELGHDYIDVVKMDIEGAEYDVLESLLNTPVKIRQLLIEFHDRFVDGGIGATKRAITTLSNHGFRVFAASNTHEEISFINTSF